MKRIGLVVVLGVLLLIVAAELVVLSLLVATMHVAPTLPTPEAIPPVEFTELMRDEDRFLPLSLISLPERVEATIILCEDIASTHDVYSGAQDERPFLDIPNRILSVNELKTAETYVSCNMEFGSTFVYTVISEPYEREIMEDYRPLAVDVLRWGWDTDFVFHDHIFLADDGVIPCGDGTWNRANVLLYLLPAR